MMDLTEQSPLIVVKVGGSALDSTEALLNLLDQCTTLPNLVPVFVHGGGQQVATLLNSLGKESNKYQGLRITPDEDMPYVAGVLCGMLNKQLVSLAHQAGLNPVGLSVADGNIIIAQAWEEKLGAVGKPVKTDTTLIKQLVTNNFHPILASIGISAQGRLLNINADHAAAALAEALTCPLLLLSDVEAVLDAQKMPIQYLTPTSINQFIQDGVIADGMKVKVESALDVAQKSRQPVVIAGWKSSIKEVLEEKAGTYILPEG